MFRKALIILSLFLINLQAASAVPQQQPTRQRSFSQARFLYDQVKTVDPRVTNLMEWERAASEILKYLKESPKSKDAPQAMFALGRLYEKTFQARQFRTGLTRAVYFYEKLSHDFPSDGLADDALLSLGELRKSGLGDDVGARAAYSEIVDKYKSGDRFAEAEKRLKALELSGVKVAATAPAKPDLPLDNGPEIGQKTPEKPAEKTPEKKPAIMVEKSPEKNAEEGGSLLSGLLGGLTGNKASGKEVYSKKRDLKRALIVIDAGHGGEDLGALGQDNVQEKDVVLNIALFLDELLRERLRARTVLTRGRDIFIPLPERTKIANDNQADLFISIHANASVYKTARGIETYYLDNTNDKSSLKLAERENASLSFSGHQMGDLGFIMSDLIQNQKIDDSITLAHHIQDSMVGTLGRYYPDVKDLGVKKAPFFVLVGAHMPCVLAEVSFIDHPEEGRRLVDKRYQKLIAESMYRAVRDFFGKR